MLRIRKRSLMILMAAFLVLVLAAGCAPAAEPSAEKNRKNQLRHNSSTLPPVVLLELISPLGRGAVADILNKTLTVLMQAHKVQELQ